MTRKPFRIRESLDDVGVELHDMRTELHKLMGVIEDKDKEITTLEGHLRASKDEVNHRERAMTDLKSLMSDLESRNVDLKKSVDDLRSSEEGSPRLAEETKPSETPKLTAEKGNDRLQSLISKYRSYGEQSQGERRIKPIGLAGSKMGLVTRGRSFGPAAPKNRDSGEPQVSSLCEDGVGHQGEAPAHTEASSGQGSEMAGDRVSETFPGYGDEFEDDGTGSGFEREGEELDTQEQQDINALIQRPGSRPKPTPSVSPPKITSRVLENLLKSGSLDQ
ncbi:hypothetical protein ScPMuIL_017453 [Solemya velum]